MDLQELLDYTAGFYLDDRAALVSGASDSLFEDATLVVHLNWAADEFAKRTWRLTSTYSSTAPAELEAALKVTLTEGVKDYAYSKRILRILSAKPEDSDIELREISYNDSKPTVWPYPNYDFFDINAPYVSTPGRPQWWTVEAANNIIRFRPTPSADEEGLVVELRAVHMPFVQLTLEDLNGVPEIEEDYHELLCKAAAGKALSASNVDSDPEAKRLSRTYLSEFYAECRQAKSDYIAKTRGPARFRFGGWANSGNDKY